MPSIPAVIARRPCCISWRTSPTTTLHFSAIICAAATTGTDHDPDRPRRGAGRSADRFGRGGAVDAAARSASIDARTAASDRPAGGRHHVVGAGTVGLGPPFGVDSDRAGVAAQRLGRDLPTVLGGIQSVDIYLIWDSHACRDGPRVA